MWTRKTKFEKCLKFKLGILLHTLLSIQIQQKHIVRGTNLITTQRWSLMTSEPAWSSVDTMMAGWVCLLMWQQLRPAGFIHAHAAFFCAWACCVTCIYTETTHTQGLFFPLPELFWRTFWLFRNELSISGDPPTPCVCVWDHKHTLCSTAALTSVMAFRAVSEPMLRSDPGTLLDTVAGTMTMGTQNSLYLSRAVESSSNPM